MNLKSSRREFMARMGYAGTITASCLAFPCATKAQESSPQLHSNSRLAKCLGVKTEAAATDARMPLAKNLRCGDEESHQTKIGNYHKGLAHNPLGEVDLQAYAAMCDAIATQKSDAFEKVPLGGTAKLSNPQGGLAFDLEGCDSQQTFMATPPTLSSAWRAGEMVENYWMALLRDVNFTDYAADETTAIAASELNKLSDFRAPKQKGAFTAQTLFRGCTPGDLVGPYVSQFLLQPVRFGALHVNQQIATYEPASDYMSGTDSWLLVQNGRNSYVENRIDRQPRYIRNGRDLSAYVHFDCPYQAYQVAALWMMKNDVPLNPGNPYEKSQTQEGFLTFGGPHVLSLLAEVSNRALKAVWYHKWYVHRTLRPEAYGGLVHWTMTGRRNYPVHTDGLNSKAAA